MTTRFGRCDWTVEDRSCLALICRLVTIDVALAISFGAKEPGLGYVSSSILVHMWNLLSS